MNAQTERLSVAGAAGQIEVARDVAAGTPRGVAVIAHPHPQFGGTMDNKVVQTLARAAVASGWTALRFNFRGIGASEGAYDEGRGEIDDMLAVIDQLAPDGDLVLAGFSFGAFIASHAVAARAGARTIRHVVLVGTAASRFTVAPVPEALREHTLVLHGEVDDTVPLASVMDWARPQTLPVTVVPGGEHFFHGQLPLLKQLATTRLRG